MRRNTLTIFFLDTDIFNSLIDKYNEPKIGGKIKTISLGLFLVLICSLWGEQVSVNTAQLAAENWFKFISRIENPILKNFEIMSYSDTTTIYIFNFEEEGFVITPATNDVKPILAYNQVGEIGSNGGPEFEWMMNCYKEQVFYVIIEEIVNENSRTMWQDILDDNIPQDNVHIVLAMPETWHQSSPYNDFVPSIDEVRCGAGCGPVAMAQIINYHKYCSDFEFDNDLLRSNYRTEIPEDIKIDEDYIVNDFIKFDQLDGYLNEIRTVFDDNQNIILDNHLAALSFACGIASRANYRPQGTGTKSCRMEFSLKQYFGYNSLYRDRSLFTYTEWLDLLENQLLASQPILYLGWDYDGAGHAFILHGYYIMGFPTLEHWFLVNWGWGPEGYDGYFTLNNLVLSGYVWDYDQEAIIDIKPMALTLAGKVLDANPIFTWLPFVMDDLEIFYVDLQEPPPPPTGTEIDYDSKYYRYVLQFDEYPNQNNLYQFNYTSEDKYEDNEQIYQIDGNSDFMFIPDIELFRQDKPLRDKWNWDSFPVLERTGNEPVEAIPVLVNISGFEEITSIDVLNEGYQGYGELTYDDVNLWYTQNPPYELQSSRCYKIKILPEGGLTCERTLERTGSLLEPYTTIDLIAGQDNWIGYWIKASMDLDVAFGGHFDKVLSIKTEEWAYIHDTPRSEPIPSNRIRPLRYEKGYVVRVSEDIYGFQWNVGGFGIEKFINPAPQYFIFQEQPDYEVIDILDIPEDVVEIGVFQDDVCIGAVAVDEPAEQLLAYTDPLQRGGGNISFQVVNNNRCLEHINHYQVLNAETGEYVNGNLFAGNIDFAVVKLNSTEDPEVPGFSNLNLKISNYPNPFNPVTIIKFSLPKKSEVELTIYNIKGQKVKTLLKSHLLHGEHSIVWDGKDMNEKPVSSGIYFTKLKAGNKKIVKKMMMLK